MLKYAEQQVGRVKELLKSPTPENFEAANESLGALVTALQSFIADPAERGMRNAGDAAFLSRLPSEMAHIRLLFHSPIDFLEGLALFRAQRFGSYNRDGQVKSLGQETAARTITHL